MKMKKTIKFILWIAFIFSGGYCCTTPVKDSTSHYVAEEGQKKVEDVKKDINQYVQDESAKKFINRELDDLKQNIDDLTAQNDALRSAKDSLVLINDKLTKNIAALKTQAQRNLFIGGGIALLIKFLLWFLFKFVVPSALSVVTDKIKAAIKDWFKKNVVDKIWKSNDKNSN